MTFKPPLKGTGVFEMRRQEHSKSHNSGTRDEMKKVDQTHKRTRVAGRILHSDVWMAEGLKMDCVVSFWVSWIVSAGCVIVLCRSPAMG